MASPLRSIDLSTRHAPVAPRRTTGGIGRSPAPVVPTARRRPPAAAGGAWRTVGVGAHADYGFNVSCDDCSLAGSSACEDCIVTFLCPDPGAVLGAAAAHGAASSSTKRSVTVSPAEAQTLALFCNVGLAPQLRRVPR